MSDQYLGEIRMVGFTFAPQGWALCDGATLSIQANTALFSLLGTTYGGNGTTNFQLPDLQGRTAVGVGNGVGLAPMIQGQSGGTNSVTLQTANLPSHTHTLQGSTAVGSAASPSGGVLAEVNTGTPRAPSVASAYGAATSLAAMSGSAISPTGGGTPVTVQPPYLGMCYIIALVGIYPTRS